MCAYVHMWEVVDVDESVWDLCLNIQSTSFLLVFCRTLQKTSSYWVFEYCTVYELLVIRSMCLRVCANIVLIARGFCPHNGLC